MATKASTMKEDRPAPLKRQEPSALGNLGGGLTGSWGKLTHFLSDVRAEMKKVVYPSRKEVETTTTVVIITTFLYGLFFYVVDFFFSNGVTRIIDRFTGQ